MAVVPVVEAVTRQSSLDYEAEPRARIASPSGATSAGRIIVGEQDEMFDPLGNRDQGQAISPKRRPNRNAQQKMRRPCRLPALRKAQNIRRRAKTNRATNWATYKLFWGIEVSDGKTSTRIDE